MDTTEIQTYPGHEAAPSGEGLVQSGKVRPAGGADAGGVPFSAPEQRPQYLLCEQCQAPVDRDQRYCVRCGARQSHASNPATAYFAAAARSRRTGTGQARRSPFAGPLFALFLVLLPLGVAAGVLVGRSGSSANNDKLIAALQKLPAAASPAAGASEAAASNTASSNTASSGNLSSDFSLSRGYTVKLSTLPLKGTTQAAVSNAESQARAKGAGKVGLISPKDFKTTPSQGATNYVIYSGEYKTRAEAQKALAKLKSKFPGAQVIAVSGVSSGGGAVVAHTAFGTVHQIAGSHATSQQIKQDQKVVQKINKTVGKSYVQAQKGLPDVIPVGGEGSSGSGQSEKAAEKLGEH